MIIEESKIIVISLGGSLIYSGCIDIIFLKNFKEFILSEIETGKRFVIVTSGGKICRQYQSALAQISPGATKEAKNWLGCKVTQLNAILLKHIFGDFATIIPLFDQKNNIAWDTPIYLGAGFEPGHSTDMDTVLLTETVGAKKIINLSNIEFLYNKDPKKYKDAKKITYSSWDQLIEKKKKKWFPGLNVPFDPIAAKKAKELNLKVAIIAGKNLDQLSLFLENSKFIGTKISS